MPALSTHLDKDSLATFQLPHFLPFQCPQKLYSAFFSLSDFLHHPFDATPNPCTSTKASRQPTKKYKKAHERLLSNWAQKVVSAPIFFIRLVYHEFTQPPTSTPSFRWVTHSFFLVFSIRFTFEEATCWIFSFSIFFLFWRARFMGC